jgi:hypothetical protein
MEVNQTTALHTYIINIGRYSYVIIARSQLEALERLKEYILPDEDVTVLTAGQLVVYGFRSRFASDNPECDQQHYQTDVYELRGGEWERVA